jgi:hypothetical protein
MASIVTSSFSADYIFGLDSADLTSSPTYVTPVLNGPAFFYGANGNNGGGGAANPSDLSGGGVPPVLTVQERAAAIKRQM